MTDLEKLMRDLNPNDVICDKSRTTKNMVLKAIMDGEKDGEGVIKSLNIVADKECRNRVEILLKIYLPIYDMIFEKNAASDSDNSDAEKASCESSLCSRCSFNCKK